MTSKTLRIEILCVLATTFILTATVYAEIQPDVPANHKESLASVSTLKMEARGEEPDGKVTEVTPSTNFGSTSKVTVIYANRKSPETEKAKKPNSPVGDRIWRIAKTSSRDSYLDALDHSHTSKDPLEDIVRVDIKPKVNKLIRRDYAEGPVYRPSGDQSGAYEQSSSPNGVAYSRTKKISRISFDGPTQEPFLPTPSDAYSLPVQSSINNFNNGGYGSPQDTYGHPEPHTKYEVPSNSYGPAPIQQNSYGSYGSKVYQPAGTPHQAYGPPVPSHGPIQDYTQNLPFLPSFDFIWPFALKLNAFTIAKILLKLVIFKMIVKFIAVICLLLFIPKLEIVKKGDKDDDNDQDDSRSRLLTSDSSLEKLNILTAWVTTSIEEYEIKSKKFIDNPNIDCTNFGCRIRKFLMFKESWNDYVRLFKNYVAEETENFQDKSIQTNVL